MDRATRHSPRQDRLGAAAALKTSLSGLSIGGEYVRHADDSDEPPGIRTVNHRKKRTIAETPERSIEWLIEHEELSGPVICASPNQLPNRDFMRILREAAHRSVGLPASRWMLEVGAFALRTETELLLKSRRVVPAKLAAAGFTFDFSELAAALVEIEAARGT